jgi:hypothetical protein
MPCVAGMMSVAWAALQVAALMALPLALWHLVWRPHAVARSFAWQGIRGPPYTFLTGSMPEAKRLAAAGRIGVLPLDARCHDIYPLVLPHLHRWLDQYGKPNHTVNPTITFGFRSHQFFPWRVSPILLVFCSSLTYYGFRGDLKYMKFLQTLLFFYFLP